MSLRELRLRRGWSQQLLAIKAWSSTATISAIERYNFIPRRADTRERLARALGVDPMILWSGKDRERGEVANGH